LIRHAGAMALPILSLAVSMIEPPFGAALVTAVGFAPLEAAGFFTTTGTAITLAPITVTAEIKHRAAGRKVTHTLTKGCGMSDRHRFGKGALDNWRRSWQDDSRLIGAPLIGATNEKTPGCGNNRGSPLYLSRNSSYQTPGGPETAFGDDIQSHSRLRR